MSPVFVVIANVLIQQLSQVFLIQHDHVSAKHLACLPAAREGMLDQTRLIKHFMRKVQFVAKLGALLAILAGLSFALEHGYSLHKSELPDVPSGGR